MALRFRNSIRIAPGIRLNTDKNSMNLSAGNEGIYSNLELPGTGLTYRTRLDNSASQRKRAEQEEKRQNRRERQQAAFKNNPDLAELTLDLDAKGNLLINTDGGQPLSPEANRKLLLNFNAEIYEWLEEQKEIINGDIKLLINPHVDILTPDTVSLRHQIDPFIELQPEQPKFEKAPAEPIKPTAPEITWKNRLVPGRKAKYLAAYQAKADAWQTAHQAWQEETTRLKEIQAAPLAAYQVELEDWRTRKEIHDNQQRELSANFADRLATDPKVMVEVLKAELDALDWARETLIRFNIDETGRQLNLDVDLPEIETFPAQEARLGPRDLRLLITDKNTTQLHRDYARHVHGVFLRIIGVAFHALPSLEELIISGYSKKDYLFSAKVKRSVFSKINFRNLREVDPFIALERFELVRDMTEDGTFQPIEPLT